MCSRLSINWNLSASYSPRTQGLAERMIQHMKNCLAIVDFNFEQLPLIQLFHNTSIIGDSPFSPHEIIFGLKANVSPLIDVGPTGEFDDDFSRRIA
jgi:hypothetical protein